MTDTVSPFDAESLWRAMTNGEAVLIDVRTEAEFAAGHPKGAVHVALYEDVQDRRALRPGFVEQVADVQGALDPGVILVISCRTGARSRQAVQVLRASGVAPVADFPGGWDGKTDSWGRVTALGWRGAGLPIATAEEPV